jgi:hypothetical protein
VSKKGRKQPKKGKFKKNLGANKSYREKKQPDTLHSKDAAKTCTIDPQVKHNYLHQQTASSHTYPYLSVKTWWLSSCTIF